MSTDWLDQALADFANLWPAGWFLHYGFNVNGLLAVILVCLICGAVGSLVVGNRMAFFSDALAHTAFSGIALGLLVGLLIDARQDDPFYHYGLPLIMVAFGALVGLLIAFVREKTGLANDTVIGVFFAGVVGFGALIMKGLSRHGYFNLESFLFGDPITASSGDLLVLFGLAVVTLVILLLLYNQMVFASFNPSLARSRNVRLQLCNYLFIVLLALIVNLSQKAVGVLLINGMLIVPAATAGNLCRNMRQLFWTTIALSVTAGVLGIWLSNQTVRVGNRPLSFGSAGVIVMLTVLFFFLSMSLRPYLQRWTTRATPLPSLPKP